MTGGTRRARDRTAGMAIRDVLLADLRLRFAARSPSFDSPPAPVVVFPAAHPEVGDLSVWDDGDEATVVIGRLTHSHFNPYDSTLTDQEIAERVTSEVADFLADVFADRVVAWVPSDRRVGGWCRRHDERVEPSGRDGIQRFVWSGPLAADVP